MEITNIGIIGVGGFAETHLDALKYCSEIGKGKLVAAVIREQDRLTFCETENRLLSSGVTIYRSHNEMFEKEKNRIELISIPTGIDQHAPLSISALNSGYNVLCEKPVSGSLTETFAMREAAKRTNKILSIGYQNIFSPSIQKIKALTLQKKFGELLSVSTWVAWPRWADYYTRNHWAGKISVNDKKVFDSPAMNAASHFLQNMLYVAGDSPENALFPQTLYGECYRAKEIESADTQYIELISKTGVKLTFIASHACAINEGPFTRYQYESGVINWDGRDGATLYKKTGNKFSEVEHFENGNTRIHFNVFTDTIDAIHQNRAPLCNIENSWQQVFVINSLFDSANGVAAINNDYYELTTNGSETTNMEDANKFNRVIPGINETMKECDKRLEGFYKVGTPWGVQGATLECDAKLEELLSENR